MNLKTLQAEQKEWSQLNFGDQPAYFALLGALEELGELAHAHLKQAQKIRGDGLQHETDAQDAVADVIIYLADYCWRRGWDIGDIVENVWNEVKCRNWKQFPQNGLAE